MEMITLFDSELKIMNIIWEYNGITAKEISLIASKKFEWNKNTTYTVIKKLINKGALLRSEPNFICKALITKEQVQVTETRKLIDKLFGGSSKLLMSRFIEDEQLSHDELQNLKDMINKKL